MFIISLSYNTTSKGRREGVDQVSITITIEQAIAQMFASREDKVLKLLKKKSFKNFAAFGYEKSMKLPILIQNFAKVSKICTTAQYEQKKKKKARPL